MNPDVLVTNEGQQFFVLLPNTVVNFYGAILKVISVNFDPTTSQVKSYTLEFMLGVAEAVKDYNFSLENGREPGTKTPHIGTIPAKEFCKQLTY